MLVVGARATIPSQGATPIESQQEMIPRTKPTKVNSVMEFQAILTAAQSDPNALAVFQDDVVGIQGDFGIPRFVAHLPECSAPRLVQERSLLYKYMLATAEPFHAPYSWVGVLAWSQGKRAFSERPETGS